MSRKHRHTSSSYKTREAHNFGSKRQMSRFSRVLDISPPPALYGRTTTAMHDIEYTPPPPSLLPQEEVT